MTIFEFISSRPPTTCDVLTVGLALVVAVLIVRRLHGRNR